MGAQDHSARIPKPEEPETSAGFEFKQTITERVDLLPVLRGPMLASTIKKSLEFGQFIGVIFLTFFEEISRRARPAFHQQIDAGLGTFL